MKKFPEYQLQERTVAITKVHNGRLSKKGLPFRSRQERDHQFYCRVAVATLAGRRVLCCYLHYAACSRPARPDKCDPAGRRVAAASLPRSPTQHKLIVYPNMSASCRQRAAALTRRAGLNG